MAYYFIYERQIIIGDKSSLCTDKCMVNNSFKRVCYHTYNIYALSKSQSAINTTNVAVSVEARHRPCICLVCQSQ